eukprot:jgi/Bigna1/87608/estExt_fgenesh1_pg.C_220087
MHNATQISLSKPDIDEACKKKSISNNLMVTLSFKADRKSNARRNLFKDREGGLEKPTDSLWQEIDLTEEIKMNEKLMEKLSNFGNEKLVWAGLVQKWSTGRGVYQQRVLVLSSRSFYNFKRSTTKKKGKEETEYVFNWRYTYESLKWITCSSASNEFILHLPNEKDDYRYKCPHNQYICQLMSGLVGVTCGRENWIYLDLVEEENLNLYHTFRKGRHTDIRRLSIDRKVAVRNITPPPSRKSKPYMPVSAAAFARRWISIAVFDALSRNDALMPGGQRRLSLSATLVSPTAEQRQNVERRLSYESIASIISSYTSPGLRCVRSFRLRPENLSASVVVLGGDKKGKIPPYIEMWAAGMNNKLTVTHIPNPVDKKAVQRAVMADATIFAYSVSEVHGLRDICNIREAAVQERTLMLVKDFAKIGEPDLASAEALGNDFPHALMNTTAGIGAAAADDDADNQKKRLRLRSSNIDISFSFLFFYFYFFFNFNAIMNVVIVTCAVRGKDVAKSWQAYNIDVLPTDNREWSQALQQLCGRIAMEQNKIFEGIINIKHTSYSWKPKFQPGAYFYRIVKNEEEAEMWLYSYSHAAPWEEPVYQLRVSQAKMVSGKEPLSSTLKITKSNDKEEKFVLSFSSHRQKSTIHDLIAKCKTHGTGNSQLGE